MQIQDVESLLAKMEEGFHPKWLFFWGHQPSADGSVGKSCLSQWWEGSPFQIDGVIYRTAEHYMMAQKAELFGDAETKQAILNAEHPGAAKKLGRKVAGFDEIQWRSARNKIVVEGNLAKFSQDPSLRDFLQLTGERVLVEASPRDQIWGIGLSAQNPNAEKPAEWKGLNLLGFALMRVRSRLADSVA